MEKMGAAVGDEARILYYREGEHGGLCRWAPMAEPERDPRFGRTEEGFGEDPHLGGQMASAYIKGMRGDNPNYIKQQLRLNILPVIIQKIGHFVYQLIRAAFMNIIWSRIAGAS